MEMQIISAHLRWVLDRLGRYPFDFILLYSRGVREFLGIRPSQIFYLEKKGIIPRVRRGENGRLEWTQEEAREMLKRLIRYLERKKSLWGELPE